MTLAVIMVPPTLSLTLIRLLNALCPWDAGTCLITPILVMAPFVSNRTLTDTFQVVPLL